MTRYPTINYIQPFTNDEIMAGKKCILNHMRRTEEAERARQHHIEISSAKKRRVTSKSRFQLNVKDATNATMQLDSEIANETKQADANNAAVNSDGNGEEEDKKQNEELKPRQRALGGVWIESSDFPHAF